MVVIFVLTKIQVFMSTITDILKTAINLGACEKSSTATDWKSLCWLLFSPQGVEFCEKHNFPSIEQFRELESENLSDFGVFIDKGKISRINDSCIALVGNTRGELVFDDNTKVHKVIVMHGAEAFNGSGKPRHQKRNRRLCM